MGRAARGTEAIGVALGSAGLLVTASAARRGLAAGEEDAFRAANDLPDGIYPVIWAPMQYGTFGTTPAIAALAALRGRRRLGLSLLAAGTIAWVGAKGIKALVRRERPAGVVGEVRIRGGESGAHGFPSGHAAVSAALTTVAMPALPSEVRAGAIGLAGVVSFARVYIGAHLPLDVIGGASLGVAVGSVVRLALGRAARRERTR
ncbi:MAG TPA: phosphatase PAP2 family protein [Actinomycetota bacterium]|nr:phosphatase PAP2 family protein [Actinomycetota bacterium]